MHIDESHEATLVEALRLLREATSLINMTIRDMGEDGGKRERLIRDVLDGMAKRISSAHREGEKLFRRRHSDKLWDDPYRPLQPKWGGGPPPFRIDRSELEALLADEPPEPPEPPPLEPPES